MSTWFPESPADDGSSGLPDRTARPFPGPQHPGPQHSDQQRSDSYLERYSPEQYPMAPGEPPELPIRRSQPGGGGLFDPVPGPLSSPAGGGGLFDPVPGPLASPSPPSPLSPPGPARPGQETQFLPSARPAVDPDGHGDPGQPAVPPARTGAPSDAAPYDVSAASGRRAGRGNPPRPPASSTRGNTPSTRGAGPGPLIPNTGAPLGSRPGYPEQQPAPGYADPQYADSQYPDQQYADPQYPDQQYPDQPPTATPESGPARSRGGELHGRAPGQSLSRMLAAWAWPVVVIGLFVSEDGSSAFGRIPAWSAFALACLVLVGVGAFGGSQGPGSGRTWTLGVVGASGLVAFWVLLVLPTISRNTSFALTLGVVLASAAMWLTPGRRRF